MDNKILELKEKFVSELEKIDNLADIENIRVSYLGKKGSVTDLLKGMKELFDAEVKKQVAKEKAEFLKGHTPPASKEKAGDKSYSDYKKTGNVKGMIGEKLNGLFSGEE